MVLLSILSIPFIAAIILLFVKQNEKANYIAIASSGITLALALNIAFNGAANFDASWISSINARFVLTADGLSKILLLLTGISFPAIFMATSKNEIKNRSQFLSLMLFTQTGLLGVFLAGDALLFYFFWELALIPVYFLCSIWGGEKRIAVTFKFFIYTFLGSLFMLIGIILVYTHTADQSFAIQSFKEASLSGGKQLTAFALF
jgi:NADH-quinone oxidoreductase subunit M